MGFSFYGNQPAVSFIKRCIKNNVLSHSYLITGDAGLGKRTFAEYFAAAILCRGEDIPCGQCTSCRKLISGNHPDVVRIRSKTERGEISVSQIRDIKADAYIMPNDGDYKIYIIENADKMNISAANAALKMLEEPPRRAVFLLTASGAQSLPETVASRCVEIRLQHLNREDGMNALSRLAPDETAQDCVRALEYSDYNIGTALQILTDPEYEEADRTADGALKAAADNDEYELLRILSAKKDYKFFRQVLWCLFRKLNLAAKIKTGVLDPCSGDKAASEMTLRQIVKLSDIVRDAADIVETNADIALLASSVAAKYNLSE